MPWARIALAILCGPLLWLAGAIFFDFVHFVLHGMLRSSSRLLRALAWPHAIHHRWIDRDLVVQWAYQRRNVWCHIVPEYGTQLVFTALVAFVLPLPFAAVLATLQTAVFVGVLRARGLDPNHRPIRMLDAYRPGPWTPPAYHALHHVYPDAYFSAYTKAIDCLVGGAAQLRGRRFLLHGGTSPFAWALATALRREGVEALRTVPSLDEATLATTDVLVLCDPECGEVAAIESLVDATRTRKLPPEAWVVRSEPAQPTARHYFHDVRVQVRVLVVKAPAQLSPIAAERAARRAVSRIRRGAHFVSTTGLLEALRDQRRFRATAPTRPPGVPVVRHREELLALA